MHRLIKQITIFITLLTLFFVGFIWLVSYDVIKQCDFYSYGTNKYFVILDNEKKFIKSSNQKLVVTYKNEDIVVYLNTPSQYDGYYLYEFYCTTSVNFDYGLNHCMTNFGKQKCWNLFF
ncbi:MAG: hypothetical protein LBB95_02165 [Mycoplasmataceae bacterium]|jgi:predicted membrane-bound spermidine synthase|nr:hypothetical protein [Mycoplasmataceae bacterium]